MKSPEAHPAYERRVVVFLDILGFRKIIERTRLGDEDLPKEIAKVHDIFKRIQSFTKPDDLEGPSRVVTQFSDSVVISFGLNVESEAFSTLYDLLILQIDLVTAGFLCRGGITVGKILHDHQFVFGPAMVDAYELESKHANGPRILVSEDVLRVARHAHPDRHSSDDEEEYVRKLLSPDGDGRFYLDYIGQAAHDQLDEPVETYPAYLEQISRIIAIGFKDPNRGVREKYLWLAQKYLAVVNDYLKADQAQKEKFPDFFSAFTRLPRFEKEIAKFAA